MSDECDVCSHAATHHIPGHPLPRVGVCANYTYGFTRNRRDFKLESGGKWWQLYYRRQSGRWESLSIWSTRDEALEAAACFVPQVRT